MVLPLPISGEGSDAVFAGSTKRKFSPPKAHCFPEMPSGWSFKRAKRESQEETQGDTKHCRKKNGQLFRKKFSTLNFFSGYSKNVIPQERNTLFEEKKRDVQRNESNKLMAPNEEACTLQKAHLRKMCPKCEIVVCGECNMLHTESSFIAHSLLDHYDRGRHSSCCSDAGFPSDHHVCKHNPGLSANSCPMLGLVISQP
ncbi:uncharacterized protein LOC140706015 [Pogona vitticeps]